MIEIRRKSIHMIPGFAAVPIVVWLGKHVAIPISVFFLLLYTMNELHLKGYIRKPIPIATHTFYIMARREELERRTFIGTIFFWSLTTIIIAVLPPTEAAVAVMISSFGDAAAAIIGKAFPNPRLLYNKKKTVAGTLAMFITSFGICIALGIDLNTSIIASTTTSFIESITPIWYLDELTVPLTAMIVFLVL